MRRAMGKKKREEMAVHEEKFISGCVKNKIPKKTAREIFRLMAQFADYGFNRCLTGDAEVVNADTGETVSIRDIAEGRSNISRTYSFDGERVFVNEIVEAFEMDRKFVGGSGAFCVAMQGDGLTDDGIRDGDLLLVEPTEAKEFEDGDLVCYLGKDADPSVHRFGRENGRRGDGSPAGRVVSVVRRLRKPNMAKAFAE